MSRTFRHTNKDSKVMRGFIVSFYFDAGWNSDERSAKRIKGGASMEEGKKERYQKYLRGTYKTGIPRRYRKLYNSYQKTKMKEDMKRKLREERYDEIGGEKFISNAGWFYY